MGVRVCVYAYECVCVCVCVRARVSNWREMCVKWIERSTPETERENAAAADRWYG